MADDKSKQDGRDRSRVAAGQDYEIDHFARQHGITPNEARKLVAKHGNNRAKLMEALANAKVAHQHHEGAQSSHG